MPKSFGHLTELMLSLQPFAALAAASSEPQVYLQGGADGGPDRIPKRCSTSGTRRKKKQTLEGRYLHLRVSIKAVIVRQAMEGL